MFRTESEKDKILAAVFVVIVSVVSVATAQDNTVLTHEISVQVDRFLLPSGNGIDQHATDTGGFVISYHYHFNNWLAADTSYGYDRNTQQNFTSTGALNVQANVHQATGALVVTIPHRVFRFSPYVLAGAGALMFDPTGNAGGFVPGAQTQTKAAFVYGGGVDYKLTEHIFLRAEYRGVRIRPAGLWLGTRSIRVRQPIQRSLQPESYFGFKRA